MKVFFTLEKYKKRRNEFKQSEEYSFYMKNKNHLSSLPIYSYLSNSEDDFDIMRCNILLQALKNKETIEESVKSLSTFIDINNKSGLIKFKVGVKDLTVSLPYYQDGKNHIFIPFYSKALNSIYTNEPEKLLAYPYNNLAENFENSLIDAFDLYGAELYNSYFTRLVKVGSKNKEIAYFHYDTNTIYFVNSQGRLDAKLVLFDKFIKRPNYAHMLERINPVIKGYYDNNREEMIQALYKSGFISTKLLEMLKRD